MAWVMNPASITAECGLLYIRNSSINPERAYPPIKIIMRFVFRLKIRNDTYKQTPRITTVPNCLTISTILISLKRSVKRIPKNHRKRHRKNIEWFFSKRILRVDK